MMSKSIWAKVIAKSVSPEGLEITTVQTQAPKFLDAEVEKHRMLSSNSSSDRAIPLSKMVSNPYFLPEDVRRGERGMQGYTAVEDHEVARLHTDLQFLREQTCKVLGQHPGVHKQHLNRYLLGFSLQSKVMTATSDQWDYFNMLRQAADADPAIIQLAKSIESAITNTPAVSLEPGEWHTPYYAQGYWKPWEPSQLSDRFGATLEQALAVSSARCARVSYDTFDGGASTLEADVKLGQWLADNLHLTPFEHQASPMGTTTTQSLSQELDAGSSHIDLKGRVWSGNFRGWVQNRKTMEAKVDA